MPKPHMVNRKLDRIMFDQYIDGVGQGLWIGFIVGVVITSIMVWIF